MNKFINKIKKWFYTKDGFEQQEINKQLITIVISVIFTVISVIGVTYSAFVWSDNSVKNQNLVVGNIELNISSNSSSLGSGLDYPVAASEESSLTPYTFTITNTGALSSTYRLKIVNDDAYTNTLDKQYIYISMDGSRVINRTPLSSYETLPIDSGILAPNEAKTYDLRMWIIENAPNSVIGQQWHGKILLESSQTNLVADVNASDLTAISDTDAETSAYVTTFTLDNTESATKYFDISLTDIIISDELKTENFKWKLLEDDTTINEGDFLTVGTNLLLQRSIAIESQTSKTYKLLIWYSSSDTTGVDLTGKSLNAKVTVEYDEKMDEIALSEEPVLSNTIAGNNIQNLRLYGNSVQNGVPTPDNPVEIQSVGDKTKNLFDINNVNNWTLETGNQYYYYKIFIGANNTVTISWDNNLESNQGFYVNVANNSNDKGTGNGVWLYHSTVSNFCEKSINITADTEGYIYINISSRQYIEDKLQKLQVEEGNVATDYEPYGKYKIPVSLSGKNLFNIETYGKFLDVNKQAYALDISKYPVNTKLTVSTKDVYYYKISKTSGGAGTYQYKSNNHTFKLTQAMIDLGYLFIISPSTWRVETQENLRSQNVQIEFGSTATDYEPYVEPVTTKIYLDEPLRKIGSYADYIDFESGKIVRKISNKNITSSSITAKSGSSTDKYNYYFITFSGAKVGQTIPILSNIGGGRMTDFSLENREGIFTNTNTTFFLSFFDIKTLADAKQFVTDNYVYANYILETPTEQTIELPNITTMNGTTTISADTTIKGLFSGSY